MYRNITHFLHWSCFLKCFWIHLLVLIVCRGVYFLYTRSCNWKVNIFLLLPNRPPPPKKDYVLERAGCLRDLNWDSLSAAYQGTTWAGYWTFQSLFLHAIDGVSKIFQHLNYPFCARYHTWHSFIASCQPQPSKSNKKCWGR